MAAARLKGFPIHVWREDVWHLLCRHNHQEWGHGSVYFKLQRIGGDLLVLDQFIERYSLSSIFFLVYIHMLQPQEQIKIKGLEPLVWVLHLPPHPWRIRCHVSLCEAQTSFSRLACLQDMTDSVQYFCLCPYFATNGFLLAYLVLSCIIRLLHHHIVSIGTC